MGFLAYIKSCVWDYLFCALAASALAFTLFTGFDAARPVQEYPWIIAGSCAVLLVALFSVAYNMRTAVVGGIGLAVIVIACLVVCAYLNPGPTLVDDVEGNHVFAVALVVLSSVLVFLLSRRYGGSIALLIAGIVVFALIEYLYWKGQVVALLVFMVGSIGLVILKGYQGGIAGSDTEQLAFASVFVVSVALAVAAFAVGFGVYKLVVEPLAPPRVQMTLIVEHRRVEEVPIVGTGAATSDTGGDSGNEADGEEEQTDQEASDLLRDTFQNGLMSVFGVDVDQTGDVGATTALDQVSYIVLFGLLLLVLLIAAAIAIKKLLRRRRFATMMEGGNDSAARNLYLFFLSRFAKMRIPGPGNLTLSEYSENFKATFARFERFPATNGADFGLLSDIYVRSTFGEDAVSDDELAAFVGYYRVFYKNARRYIGRFRYLFKFFTM